ncbi:MAG: DUF1080 domain-containing protein [Bacteroidales bacterium]|nr:DUF1080 domain-containing protein [Bacteroidales bacterium]
MVKSLFLLIFGLLLPLLYTSGQDTLLLFDGRSLDGWIKTDFDGKGRVSVKNGSIILKEGSDLTGINWTGDYPVSNYEITLETMRQEGKDFFCALTFPVNSSFCTLVVGGWGGSVVGLSNINGYDAYNNFTGVVRHFSNNRWYSIRLRVTDEKIEAWLDGIDKIVDFTIGDYNLSLRWEVEPSKPLGIATYRTTGAVRNIRLVNLLR